MLSKYPCIINRKQMLWASTFVLYQHAVRATQSHLRCTLPTDPYSVAWNPIRSILTRNVSILLIFKCKMSACWMPLDFHFFLRIVSSFAFDYHNVYVCIHANRMHLFIQSLRRHRKWNTMQFTVNVFLFYYEIKTYT